jgi:hypothetical protein
VGGGVVYFLVRGVGARARLADVDDPPLAVLELVGAGGVGDLAGRRTLHHVVEGRASSVRSRGEDRLARDTFRVVPIGHPTDVAT